MNANLEVKIPTLKLGKYEILKNIAFSLPENSILSVVGPNGAGKTTFLKALFNPLNNENVHFKFKEQDVGKLTNRDFAKNISYLGASDFSQPQLNIEDFFKNSCYSTVFDEEKVSDILKLWELETLKQQQVCSLSLGEFQRLLLATTFYQVAELFILDEPERHLDPVGVNILKKVLRDLKTRGKSVIFTSHDINLSISAADVILGINKNGGKEFLCDRSLIETGRFLDQLFNIEFQYLKTTDGSVRVFT